ncbi:MAG TPA: proton-conducting transporter membrane subunit, partial [Blastocatellia bacterium]|nr:proton-conducting transporter membrane subunit [Blastocatellia bacterium]
MPDRFNILGIGILSWVLWLPLLGAVILFFFNREKNDAIRWFANAWIILCFLISVPLVTGLGSHHGYDRSLGGLQFIEDHDWIPLIGARYQLGVDGLALVLVLLTTLLGVVSVVCSWAYIREKGREKEYYIMILLLQTGMLGAFVSADLFLFFVFWEVMLVPMYFLIGIWGGANRLYSALKFFLYTLVGSVVMLLAVLKLFFVFPQVVQAHRPEVEATARSICSSVQGGGPDRTAQVNEPMLRMTMDAIGRAMGTD